MRILTRSEIEKTTIPEFLDAYLKDAKKLGLTIQEHQITIFDDEHVLYTFRFEDPFDGPLPMEVQAFLEDTDDGQPATTYIRGFREIFHFKVLYA